MRPVEIKPGIFWVGVIDWGLRDFHGYTIPRGTSYNNYLIVDERITLVDSVYHAFTETAIDNIRSLVDPAEIENIVINHIEPDHASGLEAIMKHCPKAVIYISEKGAKGLARHFDTSKWNIKTVNTGYTLNTGKKNLTFIETPMLHWPDSMMTYVTEDRLLFSQDAFGQHLATSHRFDDEYVASESAPDLDHAVVEYYANILMPFGTLVKKKVEELVKLGLTVDMIAPDHGVIWRKDVGGILNRYEELASGKAELSVAIVYDTMWKSTEMMTLPIMQGILKEGVDCKVIKLRASAMSEAVTEFWKARGMLVGTPTINNIMFPSVAQFLSHLRGLRPKARMVGAFGSYGWSGGAVKEAYSEFERMGLESVSPGVECVYRPSEEDKNRCYDFGREFARRVKEYHGKF